MLHWDSIGVSNIFLAVMALTNVVILLILYQRFGKK
jgi:high-affinity nickel permease